VPDDQHVTSDRNPLHIDPAFARAAEQPHAILHGLCMFGVVAHAIEVRAPRHDLAALQGRFTAPVIPGDSLDVSLWDLPGDRLAVHAHVRGIGVFGPGLASLTPRSSSR
jgi:acyl dehydratase